MTICFQKLNNCKLQNQADINEIHLLVIRMAQTMEVLPEEQAHINGVQPSESVPRKSTLYRSTRSRTTSMLPG